MNKTAGFNTGKKDAQATKVKPLNPEKFDFQAYQDYESQLLEKCEKFWQSDSGVLVYRRMRVADVFSDGCRDMKKSLEWQLGALQKSMAFKADVPNFLEPWYGIGTTASAFDIDYEWFPGQAPVVKHKFETIEEALQYPYKNVKDTAIGKQTLEMIDYFQEQTKGIIPLSYCDIQSPFNVAPNIVDTSSFLLEMIMNPESVKKFLDLLANLIIDFSKIQREKIGECLVSPGHGFASARNFEGFGMSEDNVVMIDEEMYKEFIAPVFSKVGRELNGSVFHSCGNYSSKLEVVKSINNLKMVDAAFSEETDPDPNPIEPFVDAFKNTGIVLNARIVGSLDTIKEKVTELWQPGMKLIVVTYCQTTEEQTNAYELIHKICQ